jgi:hypothetical protein
VPDLFDDPDVIERVYRDTGGKLATFGKFSAWGHLEVLDEAMLDEDLRTRVKGATHSFAFATLKLPGLAKRFGIKIDGIDFEVREVLRVTDGAEARAFLALVC